ncbi:MAG: hypothetical protein H0V73_09105 [Chloroflexi bacterium]|nr:hypothetical protein [Chloroflexota bacterium]
MTDDSRRRTLFGNAAPADGRSDGLRRGELLGEPDAGVLRDGGPADFVLVHGDPLSDPAALWRVWRVSWAPDPVVV